MKPTTVRVTEQHIADGEPGEPCLCALALALNDALAAEGADLADLQVTDAYGGWEARVEQRDVAGPRRFRAELDEEAAEFVEAFDSELPVGPAEFEFTWSEIAAEGDDE